MDDTALLAAWREGDSAAGNELMERYYKPLFQFFFSKVGGDADRTSDLAQRTFETVVRKRAAIGTSFRAFMYGVARLRLKEARRPARPGDAEDADGLELPDQGPGIDSVLAAIESRDQEEDLAARALRALSEPDQLLLELKDVEDLTSREIAEVMGVGHNRVRGIINRARRRLKDEVQTLSASDDLRRSTLRHIESWVRSVHRRIANQHPTLLRHLEKKRD